MVEVNWCKLSKSSKNQNSDVFLKVKPDCNLKVRLIGKPVKVYKIFTNDRRCIGLGSEETGKKLKEKYPNELGNLSIRYASWCIDRDDNMMKILDMPYSVARAFGVRVELIGKEISGSQEGCDWKITTNGKKGKDVRYEAIYLEETPLSGDEIQMVEDQKSEQNGHYDLRKIFKSHCFEEAEDMLLEN